MADYRIFETEIFQKDIEAVPRHERARLAAKLHAYVYPCMRRNPRSHPQARMLRNAHPETWRWRIGNWRLFYHVDDAERIVSILTLALRRDAY